MIKVSKRNAGYVVGTVAVLTNVALFFLKVWAGIVSGSLALKADAWHTLTDSVTSLIVIVANKLSLKKPDKEHPFGHGRWEQIAALVIAFLLAAIAYDFIKEAYARFMAEQTADFGTIAIVVTVISIVVNELLARYAFRIGKKFDNTSIKADAWHHRTDALSSALVLVGIFVSGWFWWIDAFMALVISALLIYATYKIAKEAVFKILGEKPSPELIDQIKTKVRTLHSDDLHPHHFLIHNYGTHMEMTLHIRVDGSMSIKDGHDIADKVENCLKEEFGISATVHVDPL